MIEYIQTAPVASLILGITVIASLFVFKNEHEARRWMLNPYSVVHGKRYLTIITSGFIHADTAHLLFNMITFFFFAFPLEMIMSSISGAVGHVFFAVVYMLSMILADISTIFKHKDNPSYFSLGASGAVSGVIFSYVLFRPDASFYLFFIPIPIPAPVFALLYVVYSIYSGRQRRDNINHDAHLWGAVAGMLLTIIFYPNVVPYFLEQVKNMLPL